MATPEEMTNQIIDQLQPQIASLVGAYVEAEADNKITPWEYFLLGQQGFTLGMSITTMIKAAMEK